MAIRVLGKFGSKFHFTEVLFVLSLLTVYLSSDLQVCIELILSAKQICGKNIINIRYGGTGKAFMFYKDYMKFPVIQNF